MSSSQAISPDGVANIESAVSTEARKTSKMMCVEIIFLDCSTHTFQIQSKALGQMLFEKVCKFLNLLEIDYFGLEYADEKNTKYWLDSLKPLCRQTGLSTASPTMYFCVKFYTPDPAQLEDEFTRYLFSLQIKKDLAAGLLQCNDNTAALMISYIVQAECGDYDAEECPDHCYLSSYKFVPYQDADLQRKIMENHKKHLSQTPAEADMNLLETARRCELYGIKMTSAKDHEGVPLNLAVAHMGVLVFQNFTKINTFSWAKIRKLSFKRKRFLIKLHPEGYGYYKDTVEFYFEGRNECKNFWKKCIENHTFFRCTDSKKPPRQKPRIFSRGSSFRYSGRTQKQVAEFVRENYIKRQPFQRSTSLRVTNSSHGGAIGTSVSAQPLLPVSSSLSCGSMAAIAQESSPPPLKKLSSSEPTTPHIAQDASQMLTNGNVMQDKQEAEGSNQDASPAKDGFISSQSKLKAPVDVEIRQSIPTRGSENNNNTCLKPDLYSKSVEESVTNKMYDEDDRLISEESKYNEDLISEVELIIKPEKEPISNILGAEMTHQIYSTATTLENKHLDNTEKLDIEKNKVIANDIISELNGHSPVQSEPSEESESGSLEESSVPIFIDSFHLLGIPPFCIDSFGSVSECRFMNSKKMPADKAYYIAKELLMTERTYRRDLEIVNVVFRDEFCKQGDIPSEAVELMLSAIDPLYEVHCSLLRELEQQMAHWEGRPVKVSQNTDKGVGNILKHHLHMCKLYDAYMEKLNKILEKLTEALRNSQRFETFYQQFETHKMCYLPLTSFLLRPVHRLPYYCFLLRSLMNHYGNLHADYEDCNDALIELQESSARDENAIFNLVNYVKLTELQRNLIGFNDLLHNERLFIREGCLQKLSKAGNQQRMFFLFSDLLLYTTRTPIGRLLFKVHGQLMLSEVKVQPTESRQGAAYCFTISKGNKTLLLAASSEKERTKWLTDLSEAINREKNNNSNTSYSGQLSTNDNTELGDDVEDSSNEIEGKSISHVNTTVHVCWHRNISVSKFDLLLSLKYYLSGYLLRKFKNNSGWQKLWVVLSNLCLFFYKSYLDDSPLASLPLAGYRIDHPSPEDPITKDHVFKLQYKNHTYFFRAESQHTFNRWMEVIRWATLQEEEKTHL